VAVIHAEGKQGYGRIRVTRRLHQAWTTDITYLLTDEGWLYLAAIVDLGTRGIVGWAMNEKLLQDAQSRTHVPATIHIARSGKTWHRELDRGILQ
jgi:transposase InsO family protein